MSLTAPLPAVQPHHTPAAYQPADKHGALLVAAQALMVARERGLPAPTAIGIGPTGVIEAAMPTVDLLGWQQILERRRVAADKDHGLGGITVYGYFERRQVVLRSTDGAW